MEYGVVKFVDRFQDLPKESCCRQREGLILTESFQQKMLRGIWCITWKFFMVWFGKILKKKFQSNDQVLKICILNIKKTTYLDSFVWNFLILREQLFCITCVGTCVNMLSIYFQGKIKFSHSILSICLFWIFILI